MKAESNLSPDSGHTESAARGLTDLDERIGLFLRDSTSERLVEGVVAILGFKCQVLTEKDLNTDTLITFDMIVADADVARRVRVLLEGSDMLKPALIAVAGTDFESGPGESDSSAFDALILLPERPAVVQAQLGVAMYAHRAFASRYQSAMDELSLNRKIFKSVASGISIADARLADLPLLYVNPAFEVMTGYSLEEVQGKNCRFLQGDQRDQPGLTLVREAVAQQRMTTTVLRNFRKNGTAFWNELLLSPIRNREGQVTHFVGIQNDVTERVEFEAALRESEKLAAAGRMASTIAHEINNPLEVVTNLVYLAQTSLPAGSPTREAGLYLERANAELQRIKLITAQSLRFYKQSTDPEAVRVTQVIDSIVEVYSSRLENYGIALERRDRSTQHIVYLVGEIRQVLTNLLTNSIDAMKRSGGRLLIRTHEATDWETMRTGVVITIADTGEGMSPTTMANAYKAFYTTKGEHGTGLGLWISADIMQRHHGRIHLRSRQGARCGTVFSLFLPFQGVSGKGNPENRMSRAPGR